MSPRLVIRRVLVLSEGRQYREASVVLSRIGPNALATVAGDLPLDLLVDGLPHSAQLLETIFNKLVESGQRPNVNAEQVLWQLVRLFSSANDDATLKAKVGRLVKSLIDYQPDFYRLLITRRKSLDKAIQGLGCHGLTPDVSGLTHLHVALKGELQRHIDAYKSALHRLDELGLTSAGDSKKPVDSSHQRLLSLHHEDVQQRLIENKTVLTILDKPALRQLTPLVDMLATRVQNDKEALFCVSQIKRLQPSTEEKPVAAMLMAFSRGCGAILDLIKVPESPCHSDGYHSEPELDADRGQGAAGRYAALYYQNRPRALEALDSMPDLQYATQLKSKILLSVVVLSFRTCKNLRETRVRDAFDALKLDARSPHAQRLRADVLRCLVDTADAYDLAEIVDQVLGLVCDTLKEYKCLTSCAALKRYVADVTRTAWRLVNDEPPYELDTDFRTPVRMQPDRHQRHHASDRTSDTVRSYLWPGLVQGNRYVQKSVVVTGGGV